MRCAAVLGLVSLLAIPALAADKATLLETVTADQLAQRVAAEQRHGDKDLAHVLEGLELTERLSGTRRAQLTGLMHGDKSRQALTVLADASEILDLPPAEVPTDPAPTPDDQKAILARTVDFAANSVQILPRFFATRDTVRFERDTPARIVREPHPANAWIDLDSGTLHVLKSVAPQPPSLRPFRFVDAKQATVLYRGEQEVSLEDAHHGDKAGPERGAETWGEFGPILRLILTDVLATQPTWSHWEQAASGRLAVFRFEIPRKSSHYIVRYCCVPLIGNLMMHPVSDAPGYEGQIAVDPATGAVMRLLLLTHPFYIPIERADIAVEYGYVNLGGKQYLCPRRSVTITVGHPPRGNAPPSSQDGEEGRVLSYEPEKTTTINDVRFDDFHMALGEMRVVPEKPQPVPDTQTTPTTPDSTTPGTPATPGSAPQENGPDKKPEPPSPTGDHLPLPRTTDH